MLFLYAIYSLVLLLSLTGKSRSIPSGDLVVWDSVEEEDPPAPSPKVTLDVRAGLIDLANENEALELNTTIVELFHNCKCVYYYQCDDNNYIITDGSTLLEERMGDGEPTKTTERILCPRDGYACCKLPSDPEDKENPGGDKNDNGSRNPEDTDSTDTVTKGIKCGKQRPIFNVRIDNDDEDFDDSTIDGEFPWMVALYKLKGGKYEFKCAGSLIHSRVVVTAAHCVKGTKSDKLKIIANGRAKLSEIGDNLADERMVKEIVMHPDYYAGAAYHDIALLILDADCNITKTLVNTVCLPDQDQKFDRIRCLASGWGKSKQAVGTSDALLRKVELPVIPHQRCQELLRATRLGEYYRLHSSFLCAGGEEGHDTCNGDGGGPLVCPYKGAWVQAGIISWGVGCSVKDVPGAYADVSKYRDWVEEKMREAGVEW